MDFVGQVPGPLERRQPEFLHNVGYQYEALEQVDALVLVAGRRLFCTPDFAAMKTPMKQPVIF